MKYIWLISFVISVILDLYQVYVFGEYRYITKPAIMISLGLYYVYHISSLKADSLKWLFFIALIAAWLGDVFLLKDDFFLFGLAAFLVMQLIYSYCFWKDRLVTQPTYVYLGILLFTIGLVAAELWHLLEDLKIPVLVYMTAIGLMSITAFARDRKLSGYWLVFIGTLLFIISDTVLALHQFTEVHLGSLTVMFTYTAAQLAIVHGYILGHTKETN